MAIAETLVNMGEDAAGSVPARGSSMCRWRVASARRMMSPLLYADLCARGLVRMRHPEALYETVALLADREDHGPRSGPCRPWRCGRRGEAELLLRLKVLRAMRRK